MDGLTTRNARALARRRISRSHLVARSVLSAGLLWTALAAATPLFGQQRATVPSAPVRQAGAVAATTEAEMRIMAVVNGEQIARQQLADECLQRYGEEVLEALVNRQVIAQACRNANPPITITDRDVDAEIKRMAEKFKLSPDRWLMMLEQERGIPADQYRKEIIWPTLALKALAANQLTITDEEFAMEWEATYGAKVKARIISVDDKAKAEAIYKKVKANPSQFGEYAKNESADTNSASAYGLIPPVSKHVGDPEIERVLFSLEEGAVSPVVFAAGRYHILKCEKHLPETYIQPQHIADARQRVEDKLRDDKLRDASNELFKSLQEQAKVVNVHNHPQLRQQYPGVAAQINGQSLTIAALAEECLKRHGKDVLDGEINRKILTQELRRKNQQVTQDDLDKEIARAAMMYGYIKADGSPDLEKWQESIESTDGATLDLYVRDAVWPSVALKKLVGDSVEITNEDMQKGFEANYGERVEVLAMVLADHREAQQVWEKARSISTDEYFGKLAQQYSIDPVSRGNDGRVPPIRKHSGQPKLEEAAFKLKAGEMSGLIAIEDKYVILKCLGRTRPVVTEFEAVKDELYNDLQEKKLRIAMAKEFDRLKEGAQVDNFLAGTSTAGKKVFGPAKSDTNVKPASATRPVAAPRVGSKP